MSHATLSFSTPRLEAAALLSATVPPAFAGELAGLLTPAVKQHLPPDIQAVSDANAATRWLKAIREDADFLAVTERESHTLVGFILLYSEVNTDQMLDLRLGYVIGEPWQGRGYASEMLAGLVDACHAAGNIASLSGGAEVENVASIRVLEKNGFVRDSEPSGGTVFLTRHF
ncbi:GNAT family N-acetyltransferase [Enterovibrio paralichthyis]|uniref:GNAT family N-acetyltransferase n=1 Tax=Enterovibrio paralichthyis TaxID=2853805 RepID=UPI001C46CD28|nr:GNAT family N-acetyltransferase [Enterovibrio paralichthyis]MBV7298694.1 GNAT family N-acetyltransferase [Enterovibrio paralichthyis]